jgi:alkyldihydroxyacetonephosphate synthase
MDRPAAPIALAPGGRVTRFPPSEPLDHDVIDRLRAACSEVTTDVDACREASRDWWPLALHWALSGVAPAQAGAVCRPADDREVSAVLRVCAATGVPVTPAGGRSGVCGASVPAFGGVVLDLTALDGLVDVDTMSLVADVRAGTYGSDLEAELRSAFGCTLGHWPQSIELSTVGGWLACRSAGQYSTRYGKIEDMVVGLDVVLADGTRLRTGGFPRQAVGPDLTQLFVGSEGTLGVITGARLRVHRAPALDWRAARGFDSFVAGIDACRRILQRGATPAVLRLYDAVESARSFTAPEGVCVLIVLDEGDPTIVGATASIVADESAGGQPLDDTLVGEWLVHRNDVGALEALTRKGFVVDTMEVAAPWAHLADVYAAATAALARVPHCVAASAHLSHAYPDGACLYFSFAAIPPAEESEDTYVALWEAGTAAVSAAGGSLSHHHGVGLNRARFVADALGPGQRVLTVLKAGLDPGGILNPGKLGLASALGAVPWPD